MLKKTACCRHIGIVFFKRLNYFVLLITFFILTLHPLIARFLVNPAKDTDMRRWAAEGLSYLTLDADVKEQLIEDRKAVQALFELAKVARVFSAYQ